MHPPPPQPGPPYGFRPPPQHGYGPPRRPSSSNNVWLWVLLGSLAGVFLLCGGCIAVVGLSSSDTASTTSSTTASSPTATTRESLGASPSEEPAPASRDGVAAVGSPVRDGKFEFVVTQVDPPTKTIAPGEFWESTARGEYLVVHVSVTNISDVPQGYFADNQKLIDDQGRTFANDSSAAMGLDTDTWESDLNPGISMQVQIVFDVPPGTIPAAIEFHDSMFSGGAKVALR
ncbi:DUF4352 domain-containing protein [Nocardia cyriacigeorgica]|uniref:DUF4352 domain-containing protein n=1 Tax=Nocardia cyriacigeorgica TaxID=135487 RepID=A0A5R8P7D1_9NOCA|nr:DUF4352 domain-containing protein [Nocardia cyriacigeorgica]TLF97796.1 DUF4352 domain-containing protein [Nocardia cyriacigeorgica]